ncbi:unnamed protein product, partial [Iphiclides podalirius]
MDSSWKYKFYVVKLREGPIGNISGYVCIQRSFILESKPQCVQIKYPMENFYLKKELDEREENSLELWQVFDANVIYCTDCLLEAQAKMMMLEGRRLQEQLDTKIEMGEKSPALGTKNYTAAGSEQLAFSVNKGARECTREQTKSRVMEEADSGNKNNDITEPAHKSTCARCDLLEGKLQQMSALLEKLKTINAELKRGYIQRMRMLEGLNLISNCYPIQAEKCVQPDSELFAEFKAKKAHERRSSTLPDSGTPPEYDPNDPTWTHLHRTLTSNLIELMPNTGVYVDRNNLVHCEKLANSSKTLVRLLLPEVFKDVALRTCSVKGNRNVPGLDSKATEALLKYVKRHADSHNWPCKESELITSIRKRLHEERRKCKDNKKKKINLDQSTVQLN